LAMSGISSFKRLKASYVLLGWHLVGCFVSHYGQRWKHFDERR